MAKVTAKGPDIKIWQPVMVKKWKLKIAAPPGASVLLFSIFFKFFFSLLFILFINSLFNVYY